MAYKEPTADDNTSSATITMANGSKSKTVTNVQGLTTLESTIRSGTSIDKNYQYSDTGNVLKQTDSAGNYRTYEYDSADRQNAVNYFDKNGMQTLSSELTYDAKGNITVTEDFSYENGSKVLYRYTEKQYDGFGRMTGEAEADCQGGVPSEAYLSAKRITYTYGSDDRLTAVSYPAGFDSSVSGLTYEYGDYSRLMKINDDLTWHLYAYCANNPVNYVDPSGHYVISVGFKAEASVIIGGYGLISINTDGKNLSICTSIGGKIITNAAASISMFVNYYRHKSISGVTGWGFSTGISFSTGIKLSAAAGVDVSWNGKLTFHGGISGGIGIAYPIPYWDTEFGHTKQKKKWNLKRISTKKKSYRYFFQKISVQRKAKRVEVIKKKNKIIIYDNKKVGIRKC